MKVCFLTTVSFDVRYLDGATLLPIPYCSFAKFGPAGAVASVLLRLQAAASGGAFPWVAAETSETQLAS